MNPEGFWGYYLEGECNVRHKNIFDSAQHHPLVHPRLVLCFVDASRVVELELSFLDCAVLRPLIHNHGDQLVACCHDGKRNGSTPCVVC